MKTRVCWGVRWYVVEAWRHEQGGLIGDGWPADFGEVFFPKVETPKTSNLSLSLSSPFSFSFYLSVKPLMLHNQRVSLSLPHSSLRHGTRYRFLSFSSGQELWLACQPDSGLVLKSEYSNSREKSTQTNSQAEGFYEYLAEWCNRSVKLEYINTTCLFRNWKSYSPEQIGQFSQHL